MRGVLLLAVFLGGFCIAGFASTDDLFRQVDEDYSSAVARFENAKKNYFSSVSPEAVRAEIARRQQEKRTHDLIIAAVVACSLLLLVGLGALAERLIKKLRIFARLRLFGKKRHGSHTLDDVFETEKNR